MISRPRAVGPLVIFGVEFEVPNDGGGCVNQVWVRSHLKGMPIIPLKVNNIIETRGEKLDKV